MKEEGRNWLEGLRKFAAVCSARNPLPSRDALTTEQEFQCQIIGGSLLDWLRQYGPGLIRERAVLAHVGNWEKDPFIVFTSPTPGLVAAREILEGKGETIVFLRPDEFAEWLRDNLDTDYRWHIHTWSFFAPVDSETQGKARRHVLASGESYWLHKEGTMCGRLFGRGADHLWKWNGKEPTLLEECISQWVS